MSGINVGLLSRFLEGCPHCFSSRAYLASSLAIYQNRFIGRGRSSRPFDIHSRNDAIKDERQLWLCLTKFKVCSIHRAVFYRVLHDVPLFFPVEHNSLVPPPIRRQVDSTILAYAPPLLLWHSELRPPERKVNGRGATARRCKMADPNMLSICVRSDNKKACLCLLLITTPPRRDSCRLPPTLAAALAPPDTSRRLLSPLCFAALSRRWVTRGKSHGKHRDPSVHGV